MKLPTFPKIYNTYFVAIVATVGGMLFGFDISSMSAIIGTNQYLDFFHNPVGVHQGAINSALAAGSVVGSIMAGPVSNKIGRRDSIMFACFWWLVGTAIQAGVSRFGTLMAGRVLNGICVGITSSQVLVYLAEISKKEKRGSIIVIQQLAIEWGIFIMFFVGYGCSFIPGPSSFRLAWGLQYVPCVVLMAGLPFLPRSPRWLAKVDRAEEAIHTLARSRRAVISTTLLWLRNGRKSPRYWLQNALRRQAGANSSTMVCGGGPWQASLSKRGSSCRAPT